MRPDEYFDAKQIEKTTTMLRMGIEPSSDVTTPSCYLAGPMTGIKDHNFPAFKEAGAVLEKEGWDVINPAETDQGDTSKPREYYMRIDVEHVLGVDAVFVLPGYKASQGAMLEVFLAQQLGIPVYELHASPFEEETYRLGTKPIKEFTAVVPNLTDVSKVNDGPDEIVGIDEKEVRRELLPDSGERREFTTGSVRDTATGKGRMDLLPPRALLRYAKHMEAGAVKYGDRNWELGQPQNEFLSSGLRHLMKYMMGRDDEDHLAAAVWNIMAMLDQEERMFDGELDEKLINIGPEAT